MTEGGGGWGANKCRMIPANSAHGLRQGFDCHHRGHKSVAGLGCRWEIIYEKSSEGWVLYQYQGCHNAMLDGPPIHDLDQDVAQTMAFAAGRVFDSRLMPLGQTLQKTDFSPTQIYEALQTYAKENGWSTNFNIEVVRSRFPQSVTERDYDATGLVELAVLSGYFLSNQLGLVMLRCASCAFDVLRKFGLELQTEFPIDQS